MRILSQSNTRPDAQTALLLLKKQGGWPFIHNFLQVLLHQNTFSEGQNAFHCYITTRAPRVRNGLGSTFLCLAASGDHMSSKAALPCCVGNCLGHTSKQTSAQVQRSCGDLPPFGRHLASLSVQCSFHFHISKISPTYLCQCDTQEITVPHLSFHLLNLLQHL